MIYSFVGIDYSMTSPAICVHTSKNDNVEDWFSIDNCDFYCLLNKHTKKNEEVFTDIWSTTSSSKTSKRPRIFPSFYPENLSGLSRFSFLASWVIQCIESYDKVSSILIEGYSYGSFNGRVFEIGENGGILKHTLHLHGYQYDVIPPTSVKKFATGKGNAKKERLEESFIEETGIDFRSIFRQTSSSITPSSDLIDAYYIAKINHQQK